MQVLEDTIFLACLEVEKEIVVIRMDEQVSSRHTKRHDIQGGVFNREK